MGEYCHYLVLVPQTVDLIDEINKIGFEVNNGMRAMIKELVEGGGFINNDTEYHEDDEPYDFDDLVRYLRELGYIIHTNYLGSYVSGHTITNFKEVIKKFKDLITKVIDEVEV